MLRDEDINQLLESLEPLHRMTLRAMQDRDSWTAEGDQQVYSAIVTLSNTLEADRGISRLVAIGHSDPGLVQRLLVHLSTPRFTRLVKALGDADPNLIGEITRAYDSTDPKSTAINRHTIFTRFAVLVQVSMLDAIFGPDRCAEVLSSLLPGEL